MCTHRRSLRLTSIISLSSGTGRTFRNSASKTPTAFSLSLSCTDPVAARRIPLCCRDSPFALITTSPWSFSPGWYTRSLLVNLISMDILRLYPGDVSILSRDNFADNLLR